MRSGTRTCPSLSLPALHALQLSPSIQQHHAINLPVGMLMVLPPVLLGRIHVHGRDGDVVAFFAGGSDAATPVLGPIQLGLRNPPFLQPEFHVPAKVFVVGVPRAVVSVQSGLEFFAGCPARRGQRMAGGVNWKSRGREQALQILDLVEEFMTSGHEFSGCWVCFEIEDWGVRHLCRRWINSLRLCKYLSLSRWTFQVPMHFGFSSLSSLMRLLEI